MRQFPLQIQDRGAHNAYRQQMRDPDLQMDLHSNLQDLQTGLQSNLQLNLQADLQKDLQVNLQMDLQADLQVRMDLQPDLWVQTGHEGTLQPSPLVSFQAETSTERENLGGTCEQGPNHVSGELPIKPSRRKFGSAYSNLQGPTQIYKDLQGPTWIYKDLQPTQIYKTHHITGSTPNPSNALTSGVPSPANGQSGYTMESCDSSFSSNCSKISTHSGSV